MTDTTSTRASDHSSEAPSSELELLKTDILGRVRMPPAKREAILDAYERSGMSGPAFADYLGVKYPTFATWVQKRRRVRGESPKAKEAKAPLALFEAVVDPGEPAGGSLEVEAPGGIMVRVSRREDIALAVELLRALNGSAEC